MPLAPITDHWRIMTVWQGDSNLPDDRIVNTMHFRNDNVAGTTSQIADGLKGVMDRFWTAVAPGATSSVASFLNRLGLVSAEYRIYDLGQPEPRAPIVREPAAGLMAQPQAGGIIPREVCAVISWQTNVIAPKSNVPGKRGRGRTYIGPLADSALGDTTTTQVVLDPAFTETLRRAAAALIGESGFSLVVLSTKYAETDEVTKGFVDNAPDIQRRRGVKATQRLLFPVP